MPLTRRRSGIHPGVRTKEPWNKSQINHISVSFTVNDFALLSKITRLAEEMVHCSRSELIVQALEAMYGSVADLGPLRQQILDKYAGGGLEGSPAFTVFDDALDYELRNRTVAEIGELWGIGPWEVGHLLLAHCLR